MGVSGKWLKSLITQKKPQTTDQDKLTEKTKKKWRLWRSSSEGLDTASKTASEASDSSDPFIAAIATVARVPPKDFKVVRREWAAIRIQTAFRRFLDGVNIILGYVMSREVLEVKLTEKARRAFRALKAVVRLQAIFRGRQVRKQAAVTLRCMQALVRVQAHVRARSVMGSSEEQAVDEYGNPTKQAEQGWCNEPGTVDEVRAKIKLRQEGAIKRERANAYFLSQQRSRLCPSPKPRANKPAMSLKHHRLDKNSQEWSWLDSWMAAKPWENRLFEEIHTDPSELTSFSRGSGDNISGFYTSSSEHNPVKVRWNNVTTKILAKHQVNHLSFSPSSESPYDETSQSTSSSSASLTPVSGNILMVGKAEESFYRKPGYMNLTACTKAKLKASRFSSHKNPLAYSTGDTRGCADSDPSYLNKDLYPPSGST